MSHQPNYDIEQTPKTGVLTRAKIAHRIGQTWVDCDGGLAPAREFIQVNWAYADWAERQADPERCGVNSGHFTVRAYTRVSGQRDRSPLSEQEKRRCDAIGQLLLRAS